VKLVITVNGREVYSGVLGTHEAALTIDVSAGWWRRPRVSIAFADQEVALSQTVG